MTASNLARLQKFFTTRGYAACDIALLQPADPFLDTAGEHLRRRIFITSDLAGKNLCLRPEFTIPVCLNHLQSGGGKGRYAYGGTVFRQRDDEALEFSQAGIEDFGDDDPARADIECLSNAVGALEATGQENLELILGDQAIFVALLDALEIPAAWRKKLVRSFGDPAMLADCLEMISSGVEDPFASLPAEIRKALKSQNHNTLTDWLTERMVADGLPLSGGRTAGAIAERVFEKTELATLSLGDAQRAALEAFLAIDVDVNDAAAALGVFEKDHAIVLEGAAAAMAARSDSLGAHKNSLGSMRYRAGFGRRLDYYTGFVFEVYLPGLKKPVAGGGRYDQLMTLLGATETLPAVGFSIWVDRLAEAG